MDYKRIHDSIIERAKNRIIEGYIENHHIEPRCMGGGNGGENLVKLTAREHFLVHKLLTLIYPNNRSLIYAYWAMCGLLDNQYRVESRYTPSAKTYEDAKKQMSQITKDRLAEFNIWKGKKHSEESKEKQSKSAKDRSNKNEATRRKSISSTMKLIERSEEWAKNISDSKKGDKNPMYGLTGCGSPKSKPILQYTLNDILIKEWCSASDAYKKLGISNKAISACLKGKSKTSGGFTWKYKYLIIEEV